MSLEQIMMMEDMPRKAAFMMRKNEKNDIVKMFEETFGERTWETFEKGYLAVSKIPEGSSVHDAVEILSKRDDDDNECTSYANFMASPESDGFCHIDLFAWEEKVNILRSLGIWPSIYNMCELYGAQISDFYITDVEKKREVRYCHVAKGKPPSEFKVPVKFDAYCRDCRSRSIQDYWSWNYPQFHKDGCAKSERCMNVTANKLNFVNMRAGGLFSRKFKTSEKKPSSKGSKRITDSKTHDDKQVLNFQKSVKGDGIEPDMTRELYSVPKPTEVENMSDHLQKHKAGDMFPYFSVVGTEEETKEGRLARLRAFRSAYGKENKPEMRINGVVLDEIEGTILVRQLKEHVDESKISRQQVKQNKKFKPINEMSFKKPYLQIARITGEYVPLMSSTSDYTELYFTLEDGRLLENNTIVQSNKMPTNQNGVFELSCDYCINVSDVDQLSLKYFLSRPIMKEGHQWGSISLTIRMSESDTPYLTPKVEAMAIVRAPFTTLEEQMKDPDHADVVFTAGQIEKFKEMYRAGEIMDIDEAKRERTRASSYSKSTIRGQPKGESGPDHLDKLDGWEHLKNTIKPRLAEGEASITADSKDEDDIDVTQATREEYEAHQEKLRRQFSGIGSDGTVEIPESDLERTSPPASSHEMRSIDQVTPPKSAMKKTRFGDGLESPETKNVFQFN